MESQARKIISDIFYLSPLVHLKLFLTLLPTRSSDPNWLTSTLPTSLEPRSSSTFAMLVSSTAHLHVV